jgi:hypothetical protein
MRRSILSPVLLGLALVSPSLAASDLPAGDGPWVVKARFSERAQVARLAAEAEPWEVHYDQGYLIVDVERAGYALLLDLGFTVEVLAEETARFNRPLEPLPGQVTGIPGYPCYRTVEETYAAAQAIVTAHPTLATWIDVGDSWEKTAPGGLAGYDMQVLRLTNAAVAGPKPALFVMAAIHAREYTTAEVLTRFAEQLAGGHGNDPDAAWILDHHEVHLLLHSNPDGRKQAETGLSWRKNTDNNYCANTNSRGADLNRNFPFQWACCGGSSGSACNSTYRGPSAASEPEVQAVRDYVSALFPNVWSGGSVPPDSSGVFIDLHSYGELVLWPWGYTATPAPNATALQTLGRKFAWFNDHYPEQAIGLYPTDGTTDDFAYGARGAAAYTFEMGTSFFQSCATFESGIAPKNLAALTYAARVARRPYRFPAGPDAYGLSATPASVTPGQPVVVAATLDDTRYRNTNGTEPSQNVAAGEVYVDVPPWAPGAAPVSLVAGDGAFDETVEPAQQTLATVGWPAGRHTLYVRGRDASNNWGAVSAVFVDVAIPVELQRFTLE